MTSIELMPLGDFSGDRNWGYDGVAIFAPARCYGTPDDLRRLVDAAHQHGLAVCVDVVYNHFGPDGAYANAFSPYYFSQVDAAVFRAISVLLLTVPQTPLLFMGQEWAATTPFLYFTHHHDELGRQITEGRREEFGDFEAFCDPCRRAAVPDPLARDTFDRSRLYWDELTHEPHISMLRLYQRLLGLRRTMLPLRMARRESYDVCAVDAETVALRLKIEQQQVVVIVRLGGGGSCSVAAPGTSWHVVLTTEDADLTDDPLPIQIAYGATLEARFARPGAVIVRRLRS